MTLVEALGHARDLLAHMLDGLRAALLDSANPIFQPFGEAADFKAHAVERGGFTALDVIEALFQRVGHARQLFAHRRRRSVVVACFDGAQPLVDAFAHALDLKRDRLDRLRLAALCCSEATVHIRQRAFKPFARNAFQRRLQLTGKLVARFADHLRN